MPSIFRSELGRHGLELTCVQEVQEQCFIDVIPVVAECDLGGAQFRGDSIEVSASESRTERARRLALRDQTLHDGVGVARFNVKGNAPVRQVLRKNVGRKAWLLLVQVDRNEIKVDWCPLLQEQQDVQEAVTILPAGQADHDLIPVFNQPIVGNGLAHLATETGLELFSLLV